MADVQKPEDALKTVWNTFYGRIVRIRAKVKYLLQIADEEKQQNEVERLRKKINH